MTAIGGDPAANVTDALAAAALVQCAYDAYDALADKTVLTPAVTLPAGHTLVAWITMENFFIRSDAGSNRRFYGFIARDASERYVLAIRGTEGILEWWDDFHVLLVPFKTLTQFGAVAEGFAKIYGTLDYVMTHPDGRFVAPHEIEPGLAHAAPFATKVGAIIRADSRMRARFVSAPAPVVTVTGHSLGAALATLYVAENATTGETPVEAFYTFASPRVGDRTFSEAFAKLEYDGAPLRGLRIFNRPDLVPNVPLAVEGFEHAGTPLEIDSRASDAIKWTFPCFHNLASYMICLGAPEPASWACDASHLDPVLAEARALARTALGIVPGQTILSA